MKGWEASARRLVARGIKIGKPLRRFVGEDGRKQVKEEAKKERQGKRGRPRKIPSDLVIFLMMLSAFIPYRQLSGIYYGIFEEEIHYTTIEKRVKKEKLNWKVRSLPYGGYLFYREGIKGNKFFIDSSGFSCRRKGIWGATKFKLKVRRKWFKLHLVCNERGEVVAFAVTEGNVNDSRVFGEVVSVLPGGSQLYGDKAYFSRKNYKIAKKFGIVFHSPPKANASGRKGGSKEYREEVRLFKGWGYERWKKETGYCERFNKEFVFSRLKTMFGEGVRAVTLNGASNALFNMIIQANIGVIME
ncbi:MAG: transposase [Brevinematales bacterium]